MTKPTESWDSLQSVEQWATLLQLEDKKVPDYLKSYVADSEPPRSEVSKWRFFDENFRSIMRSLPIRHWHAVLDHVPETHIPVTQREHDHLNRLSQLWKSLESAKRATRQEAITPFIELLVEAWGWKIVKRNYHGNLLIVSVNLDTSGLKLPAIIPILVTSVDNDSPGSAAQSSRWVTDIWRRLSAGSSGGAELAINFVLGVGLETRRYQADLEEERGFLVFDELMVREVFTSESYSESCSRLLRQGLGLGRLNPYVFEGPVKNLEMFYGREGELRKILDRDNRNFAVVGSRTIGKTSLLKYLEKTTKSSGSRKPIFLDCANLEAPDSFARALCREVNPRRSSRLTISGLRQVISAVASTETVPFLFLLDEVDPLIRFATTNSDWRALAVLREISNRDLGQIVVAGYRDVYRAWQDISSPVFNFAEPMYLSVLSEESARRLIARPLASLGVKFSRNKLVTQILEESGRHPSLLQFFCSSLIERLDETGSKEVKPQDVHAVRQRRDYLEFIVRIFRNEDNLESTVERWLVLKLVKSKEDGFSGESLAGVLGEEENWLSMHKVVEALEGLELSGLIRRMDPSREESGDRDSVKYQWTVPGFGNALIKTVNVTRLETEMRRRLRDEERS